MAKYKQKYKRPLSSDEELTFFAAKVVGSAVLFFVLAVGIDVYRLFH